eukprot:762186-Hanusia_phi.AAC.7
MKYPPPYRIAHLPPRLSVKGHASYRRARGPRVGDSLSDSSDALRRPKRPGDSDGSRRNSNDRPPPRPASRLSALSPGCQPCSCAWQWCAGVTSPVLPADRRGAPPRAAARLIGLTRSLRVPRPLRCAPGRPGASPGHTLRATEPGGQVYLNRRFDGGWWEIERDAWTRTRGEASVG